MRVFLLLVLSLAAGEADDPYLWLEEVQGERALAWVRERNGRCVRTLGGSPSFAALNERLLAIADSDERIPEVQKAGDLYYNFWRDAAHPRGLWRRTTPAEYRKESPEWETVLDLDALARGEKENWVWKGVSFLKPACDRCLVSLSRGGGDAVAVREFDLVRKAFVADGFSLPEGKSHVAWRGRDSLFVAADFGEGSLTRCGYPRIVKEWARGTPLAEARTVYEGRPDDVSASAERDLAPGYERDVIRRQATFWTTEVFLRRGDRLIRIDKPDDAIAHLHRDLLLLELKSDWRIDGRVCPAGSLVASDLEAFLAGKREVEVLFEPAPRRSLGGVSLTRDHVLLNVLDNVSSRLFVARRRDGSWRVEEPVSLPPFSAAHASAVDPDASDDFFLNVNGYLSPPELLLGTAGKGTPGTLKKGPAFFKTDGLSVSQHEAVSKDGTRIPYYQVGASNLPNDGQAPTLLYGYGGFQAPVRPRYDPAAGTGWLEKGGVYVVANIRGGGEFGPAWHQAAIKANRPRAYEDFIAVAEDLVRRRITSPKHLGILGGSNGGLLMGNMITMRPDLFGAVVCRAPLLDMRRYPRLLAGSSWIAEYGNPDLPEEWAFIRSFSPYHNLRQGTAYPPVLFLTSTCDDRVHPGHARKMAARMEEMRGQVLFWENVEGGHRGSADNRQTAYRDALAYQFLWDRLK